MKMKALLLGRFQPLHLGHLKVITDIVKEAEYIVIDPSAPNYAFATSGLSALSYAIFLILITALRYTAIRLFVMVPASMIVAGMVCLRNLRLRIGGNWKFTWAFGIGFVCMQFGVGLHYWPISPIQFGLVLFGLLYAMTILSSNLLEKVAFRRAVIEPLVILSLACIIAILLPFV